MTSRVKKQSLAEKISTLVSAAPTIFGSDDENEEAKAKVVENYDENESDGEPVGSTFRKQNVDLLDQVDKRYTGKKVSRKDVYDMESDSDSGKLENSESDISKAEDSEDSNGEDDEEIDSKSEESTSDTEDDAEIDEDNPLRRERREDPSFKSFTDTNIRADIEKGNCVREQLKIWENLLEIRIKLQKCLIAGNKMPQNEIFQKYKKADPRLEKEIDNGRDKLSNLLENLLEIQEILLKNYPETKDILSRGEKRKAIEINENNDTDEEICSDTEEEAGEEEENREESMLYQEKTLPKKKKKKRNLIEFEKALADNHNAYREYRDSIIQKWNDKTRVASGSLNKGSSQSVVKQIEFLLTDKSKLLKRTQLKRSEFTILGKEESSQDEDGRRMQDYDSEIYDDDDFYHQLLRELIEYKSSDITDPVQLSKQWIALQNMRSKMKRKIDTRATKGRRVRYNVHTKLVNFMAPINNDSWSDLAKNELYNSLFGKIKSVEMPALNNVVPSDK